MHYDFENSSLLMRNLIEKQKELTSYREKISWKLHQGEAHNASEPDFDDATWKQITLPVTVDARKGEFWLRTRVVVPKDISGIEISGSAVTMQSGIIMHKTEVYVNSRKILSPAYWTELRGPRIVLDERTEPENEHLVAVHIFPKYEPVDVPVFNVFYSNIEKVAFEIDSFIQELRFAEILDKALTEKVIAEFDLKVFQENPSALIEEIEKARTKLSPLANKAKEFKVHLVAHAHIDINWLWPWTDTVNTIKNTFETMIKLLDRYPDFHFSQSQALTYTIVEEKFPDLFEAIKKRVQKGSWDVTASMWVESDLNMSGNEALARQFLLGKRYIREKFGKEPFVCWEPDTFGHIWTMPQILKKAGCDSYYLTRCAKEVISQWESPDGSRVTAFASIYNNAVTPRGIMELVLYLYKRYGLKTSMFVYGVGNHGGGATVEDIEAAYALQKKAVFPEIFFSSTHSFFKQVEKEPNFPKIPIIRDELQFAFDGCYTTHGDIKFYNRLCENLLVDAEKLSALSGIYDKDILRNAWLSTLMNQFHDILCGSGTAQAYEYPFELAETIIKTANEVIDSSFRKLAEKIGFSKHGIPIIVFNSLPWRHVGIVKVKVPKPLIPQNPVIVSSEKSEESIVQVNDDEVLFLADVPSLGYKTYYLVEGEKKAAMTSIALNENTLENEYFRVDIDTASGTIESLYDKVAQRFVFKKCRYNYSRPITRPVFNNLLQVLYELPHNMSAWIIGEIGRTENLIRNCKIELVESGPLRSTIKVTRAFKDSKITQFISLCKGAQRIDFSVIIDWKEVADDKTEAPMVKVAFTPILGNSKATFEIPFGYIERPADGTEVPALRWIDVSDEKYGVSLLNDSKYGFDVKGNTVRMTLVRTSYSPDPKPDQRIHKINYYVYPHQNSWKEALTFRKGYEVNHPLRAYVVTERLSKRSAPEEYSFIQVKPENVVLSCFKIAEDSNDYVLRLYDATGSGAKVELSFGFNVKEAYESDLLERKLKLVAIEGKSLCFTLQPFEIKTLLVSIREMPT